MIGLDELEGLVTFSGVDGLSETAEAKCLAVLPTLLAVARAAVAITPLCQDVLESGRKNRETKCKLGEFKRAVEALAAAVAALEK